MFSNDLPDEFGERIVRLETDLKQASLKIENLEETYQSLQRLQFLLRLWDANPKLAISIILSLSIEIASKMVDLIQIKKTPLKNLPALVETLFDTQGK